MEYLLHKELLETRLSHTCGQAPQVKAIEAALKRLDVGEFGYCRICGKDIDPARLRAAPENPFCPSCSD